MSPYLVGEEVRARIGEGMGHRCKVGTFDGVEE